MKTRKSLVLLLLIIIHTGCGAGIKSARTSTVRIDGDCPMCEKTIEATAYRKGEAVADWDVDAKTAEITIDSTRTSIDAVLRRIAEAGYDNERYLAPDDAYTGLPGCCQYERSMKHAPVNDKDHEQPMAAAHESHDHAAQDKSAFEAVFAHYFELKDALVAGNGAQAKQRAAALDEAMHRVDADTLPAAQQDTWEQVMNAAMPVVRPLGGTADVEKQRQLFAQLTAPMLVLAEAAGEGTIYLDHCPMYEGGADWLSRDKAIRNPFYGSMMLTCGSVVRTITK